MKRAVKVGIVGLGVRTEVLLAAFLRMDEMEVIAVCDLQEARIQKILEIFQKYGKPAPKTFTNHHDMLKLEELEAVFIPTSWNSHLAIAADCMEAGKYAAIEVGGAASLDELWQLIHAYERTKTPIMMLENCCYCRDELLVMNLARKGLLGELVYCEGGYEHNLRNTLAQMEYSGEERAYHNRFRNGELYPTHELGPIAKILRINRGNRFLSLTSTATKSVSIPSWRKEQTEKGEKAYPDVPFHQGDMITTVIKCAGGEVITLHHSVSLPRPYSRNGRVQGTKGIWLEDVKGLYIEGMSQDEVKIDPAGNPYDCHYWDKVEDYYEEYDHPIWKKYKDNLLGGHGGLDSLVIRAFLDAVDREDTPIDVYDVAAWMAVTCLSEQSIALGSMPVAFPDFTNGKWIRREPAPKNQWNLDDIYQECFE